MATRPPIERRVALTRRFQQLLTTIGDGTASRLKVQWANLDSYDEDQIPDFTRKATPILHGAKRAAVHHAAAYYSLTTGVAPVGVPFDAVPAAPDLREPFISTWRALASGAVLVAAVEAGAGRLDAVARNLVTSASRQTGDVVVDKAGLKVIGWERVPDDAACEWCLTVAPGFYTTAETADFGHDRCGCTAEPILV